MYFNDALVFETEALIEGQIIDFPDAPYCIAAC
jgi:hypothetical protein